MTPTLALCISLGYVAVLLAVSRWSSRRAGSEEDVFFVAKKSAPWPLVAFGMIGASLSGVTFLSIPGWVRDQEWTYMQMVIGYCIGYLIVASLLHDIGDEIAPLNHSEISAAVLSFCRFTTRWA